MSLFQRSLPCIPNQPFSILSRATIYECQAVRQACNYTGHPFTQKKEETLCLQALRNLQFQVVKKPGEQAVGNMDYPQQIVELYNESQPFTNKLLADLLERLDEVVSLTIGPLTYLTTVPDFRLLHQSLQRLILYDLPSHLVEKVHDMAVEFLPRLHTLSILATSCHMIAPSCDEDGAGSFQGPPFLTETAIW